MTCANPRMRWSDPISESAVMHAVVWSRAVVVARIWHGHLNGTARHNGTPPRVTAARNGTPQWHRSPKRDLLGTEQEG